MGILVAPVEKSLSMDSHVVFAGQARLLAKRAERGLPLTSGSLARLVELGGRLDAELARETRP